MNPTGITNITLKKINRGKVYQYIYQNRSTSKLQIVQDLQMGLSTVSQNLTLLEQEGLIRRDGLFESTGGRKAQIIQIVPHFRISIGVGLLKSMVHITSVDLYGNVLLTETIPLPYYDHDDYYSQLSSEIERFIEINRYTPEQILGVSIATQGIISPDGTSVTYGPIMNNTAMNISDFSSRLPYPCQLVHDSKAAAHIELWNHPKIDSAVVFLLNRNLGGAIITNRSIHQGVTMHSGAIEHICINPDGPLCYCGKRGCLETYCSANALEAHAGMSVKEFFGQLRSDPKPAQIAIWNDYLDHLAFAMKNLNIIIDSPIIISGYLAPYFRPEDLTYLLERINHLTPFPIASDSLIVGAHGQFTPAIGAALLYVSSFLETVF